MIDEPTPVLVDWIDACFHPDEIPDPLPCHSVGWLVKRTKKAVVIAMQTDNGSFRDFLCIPGPWLIKITKLEPKNVDS